MTARDAAEAVFAREGLIPETWSNDAGYRYSEHTHPYYKILLCVAGSITFHTSSGDFDLRPGDRLDLQPGTLHSATVGPRGVTCMEAHRSRSSG